VCFDTQAGWLSLLSSKLKLGDLTMIWAPEFRTEQRFQLRPTNGNCEVKSHSSSGTPNNSCVSRHGISQYYSNFGLTNQSVNIEARLDAGSMRSKINGHGPQRVGLKLNLTCYLFTEPSPRFSVI